MAELLCKKLAFTTRLAPLLVVTSTGSKLVVLNTRLSGCWKDKGQTGAFYFSQACSEDVSDFFSRNKLMIPIVLSQSLWVFSVWLVFTSNLKSQPTWLKVKFKLVNFPFVWNFEFWNGTNGKEKKNSDMDSMSNAQLNLTCGRTFLDSGSCRMCFSEATLVKRKQLWSP